jgi:hypothetical protein
MDQSRLTDYGGSGWDVDKKRGLNPNGLYYRCWRLSISRVQRGWRWVIFLCFSAFGRTQAENSLF